MFRFSRRCALGCQSALRRQNARSCNTVSFAGLRSDAQLTTTPEFREVEMPIPVLQLVGTDGVLNKGATLPFTMDEALAMYKTMVRVSVVDNILNALQRQGRISFYMTSHGEEATSVGSTAALKDNDVIWPQYRELGCFMHRGFSIQDVVDQCMGKNTEPGKGRQMPVHYCSEPLNIQAVTSPLSTQIPQAAGAGFGFRQSGQDRVAVAFFGDGAASEGDFAVALNFAATSKAQTIFICRNNGWAISTPTEDQYAGDGIAVRGVAYANLTLRVDGNDLAAVYAATKRARELSIERSVPVLLELMTYRRGHHSTSDDATRYRGKSEEGVEPIVRTRLMLEKAGKWDQAKDTELRDQAREEVMNAIQLGGKKKFAPVSAMFADVWAKEPAHLQDQRQELFEHIEKHRESYDLPAFEKEST